MARLWYDLHSKQAARRLGEAKPQSWSDYMRTTGYRVPHSEIVSLADFSGVPEPDSIPGVSDRLRWEIWERDDFTCQECGSRRHLQVDHIYPKSRGGPTVRENLRTLCKTCNMQKRDRVIFPESR